MHRIAAQNCNDYSAISANGNLQQNAVIVALFSYLLSGIGQPAVILKIDYLNLTKA